MSLNDQASRNDYTANGSTTVFPYSFRILTKTDILVLVDGTAKIVDTDYSVGGLGDSGGGNVTFVAAPANASIVTLLRNQPFEQDSDYVPNQAFPSAQITQDLDKLYMIVQELREQVTRALTLPQKEAGSVAATAFPAAADRASQYAYFDSNGNPTTIAGAVSTGTPVSAFMVTVLDDATAPLARATLGITDFIMLACSDEITALTAGTAKVTFRMPYAFTVTAVRASLTTAQTSGNIFTVDINETGVSILSTKLTIDNNESTSTTAATPPVISDSSLADDAAITIDIDQIGNGTAKGLKVELIGRKSA